jgi:hypothetical protein
MRRELDLVLVFGEDIDVVNRIVGPGERFLEQIANLGDVLAISHGEDAVLCSVVVRSSGDGSPSPPADVGAVATQDESSQNRRLGEQTGTGVCADSGGAPQGSGGVQPADAGAIFHDNAGTEKTYTGHDIGDDAHGSFVAGEGQAHIGECGGTDCYQYIGPEPGGALAPLALKPYCRAERERHEQRQDGVERHHAD